MQELMRSIEKKQMANRKVDYGPGDTITVSFRIKEGKGKIRNSRCCDSDTGNRDRDYCYVRNFPIMCMWREFFPGLSPLVSDIKFKAGRDTQGKAFLHARKDESQSYKEKK